MKKEKKEGTIETLRKQSSFLAYMSHEIRTPLNVIIGVTDILSEETFDPKEQAKLVDLLKTAEEHLMSIINNILDFSKIESGAVELSYHDFELSDLVGKLYAMLNLKAASKRITLDYDISPTLPVSLNGDSHKLRQVLLNLVSNAIKFTNTGHVKIRISELENEELPSYQQKYIKDDEITVLFEVIDTGIGIAPDKIDKLFNDYIQVDSSITSRYGGTGLGLAISKKLVEFMGGNISVESEPGQGSRFYFTIKFDLQREHPALKENTNGGNTNELYDKFKNKTRNILLVDDSEDNRVMIQLYLQKLPYKIDIAENGLIAVTKAKIMKYDLILMDIEMPVMDGYTATNRIREWEIRNNLPHTPILALSANAFEENIQEGLKKGCTSYLTKPIKKAVLIDAIEKYVFRVQ